MTAMKLINPDLTQFQANTLFERIDQDENHCISFIEFLAATLDPREVDLREIKQVHFCTHFILLLFLLLLRELFVYSTSF